MEQVYRFETTDGQEIVIEREYPEVIYDCCGDGWNCHEGTSEVVCENSIPEFNTLVIHRDGYPESTGSIFDNLREAVREVRSGFDVAREFVNKTRPGWEQYHGNDLRWPNWVELTEKEMASV